MKFRLLLLSVVLAVFAAACAPPPVLRDDGFLKDTSLLTGDPCEAPCWRNIIPGETTWRDALILVEDDPQLTNVEMVEDQESTARLINFTDAGGPQCCRVYTEDGVTVSAVLTLLAPSMNLGEIIDKYGEPTYVAGGDVTADQTLLSLLFPEIPLILYVFAEGVETGELSPASEIIGAIYLIPEDMELLLGSTEMYLWRGYTPLAGYITGEYDVTLPAPAEGE